MPAIVILGLKLPFRTLWEKVGLREHPVCSCPGTPNTYMYCPHCGVRKTTRSLKIYKSRLTGEETTYRNLNAILDHLHTQKLDLYDTNPRGYTDDPVYIYFTQPFCLLKVNSSNPVSMTAVQKHPYEIEDMLHELVGDDLWQLGDYGLWAFDSDEPEPTNYQTDDDSESPRAFILPIGPNFSM